MGGGGPSSLTDQQKANSMSEYSADIAPTRAAIIADTSIDSISKQELLNQLNQGFANLDMSHTGDYASGVIASVDQSLAQDESSDPFYVNRRNNEDQINAIITQPGQRQTNLTDNNQTPMGTPSLLTASANAAASTTSGPTAPSGGGPVG